MGSIGRQQVAAQIPIKGNSAASKGATRTAGCLCVQAVLGGAVWDLCSPTLPQCLSWLPDTTSPLLPLQVKADKQREVLAGHDGTWVAHPDLVVLAKKVSREEWALLSFTQLHSN